MDGNPKSVVVNSIEITPQEIGQEAQYHPSSNFFDAYYEATKALVIKELLIQRAVHLGLATRDGCVKNVDKFIDLVLEKEVEVPKGDESDYITYYNNNKSKFFTSPLFEVSHILRVAPQDDTEKRTAAKEELLKILESIQNDAVSFADAAAQHSQCSSAQDKGFIGQITKGQTLPAFEKVLFSMYKGEITKEPIETEVGFHIIKVHEREDGKQLPYEHVKGWIEEELQSRSWNKAFQQYIQLLLSEADVKGFSYDKATSPLVQ
ncbi:MAG: peptidylprolyl isomerase [Magnetococcales bacterium]|nr:peptidylprolyl isomerase [Magnetococcales bacterium]